MPENFDDIIKKALDGLESRDLPDWNYFYELWEAEAGLSGEDTAASEDLDSLVQEDLAGWEYDADTPDWDSFEAALTEVEEEEFDQEVRTALSEYEGLSYDEAYWEMFSYRLDALNNKPRILLLRMVETAAIALILLQLIQFYNGYKEQHGDGEFALTPYVNHLRDYLFKDREEKEHTYPLAEIADEKKNGPSSEATELMESAPFEEIQRGNDPVAANSEKLPANRSRENGENIDNLPETFAETVPMVSEERGVPALSSDQRRISLLPLSDRAEIPQKLGDKPAGSVPSVTSAGETVAAAEPRAASVPLGYRSVNLLYTAETDSFMNSLSSIQAVKPKLHSAIEAGPLLDVTTVVIRDGYFSYGSQPREEFTLNGGAFMRYKVGYKNIFGAIGMDYVRMKYSGLNQQNEVSMVTLPFELGYNVVNIPTFRMFVSGGIAGRFVPEASYSSDTYSQTSVYGKLKSKEQMNGLLHSGPFEINSYLSGRMSVGFDFSVNKTMSVGFRYTYDYWLKGEGIGFNLDKFRSRHLALGTSIHF